MPNCSVSGCDRKYYAKGWCEMHYQRDAKHGDPLGGDRNHAPANERFWRGVEVGSDNDCWPYVRGQNRGRYGRFQLGGKGSSHVGAHRYSYELHYGAVPHGLFVMHSCDNPRCVNPRHLSAGTAAANTADMIAKGRHGRDAPRGERSPFARLNEEGVRLIRGSPEKHVELARRLGVTPKTVRAVRSGQSWTHVT